MKKKYSYSKLWITLILILCILPICLYASASSEIPLTLGQAVDVSIAQGGDLVWFSFIPAQNGKYIFSSFGTQATVGYLIDPNIEEPIIEDGGNGNFQIIHQLTVGTQYSFGASFSSGESTGSFWVMLSKYNQSESGSNWSLNNGVLSISGTGPMPEYGAGGTPWYDDYITSVVIGEGITSISAYAFSECGSLTSVSIPSTITDIGMDAFFGCFVLDSVSIPSRVSNIGPEAFAYCTGLTEFSFPVSLRSIGDSAFSECVNLQSVSFEDGIVSIGPSAFKGCSNLFEVSLPDSLTSIGGEAFSGDFNLTIINIPENAHLTGPKLFAGCNKLKNNQGFIILDHLLVQYTGNSNNIEIPAGVTKIADYAFYGYSVMASVEMPDTVTAIGDFAFALWENQLFSINIPSSVTSISPSAFYGTETPSEWEVSNTFIIQNGILTKYIGTDSNPVIPSSVTSIGFRAFYERNDLESVTVPSVLRSIGEEAFAGCANLSAILGPSGSTTATRYFYDAYHLEGSGLYSVSLPATIQNIGTDAFGRTALGTLLTPDFVLPDSSVTIEQEAFSGIAAAYIVIPWNVSSISSRTFANCTQLRYVYFQNKNCVIADDAFAGCSSNLVIICQNDSDGVPSKVRLFTVNHGFQFVGDNNFGNG